MATILEVGVGVPGVLILPDLHVFRPHTQSIVGIGAALPVRLCALRQAVLGSVGILCGTVRRRFLDQVPGYIVGTGCCPIRAGLGEQAVLEIVGIGIFAIRNKVPGQVIGIAGGLSLQRSLYQPARLIVIVPGQFVPLVYIHAAAVFAGEPAGVIVGVGDLPPGAVARRDLLLHGKEPRGVVNSTSNIIR